MFTIPVNPVGKPRQTRSDRWKQRPCVLKYRAYADEVRLHCANLGYEPEDTLYISFYIPMPSSWSEKKKKSHNGQPHRSKPDLDNMVKAFLDAIFANNEADDCIVHRITADKFWALEGRIEVQTQAQWVGRLSEEIDKHVQRARE